MKRFSILLLAGCLSVFGFAQAQEPQDTQAAPPPSSAHRHHMPNVDEQLAHLTSKLNLSKEQQTSVRPILQGVHDKMGQIMQDNSASRQDRHAKMKELHESAASQIRAVLNDDQKKSFDEMKREHEEHMEHHGQGQGEGHGEGHGEDDAPPPPQS